MLRCGAKSGSRQVLSKGLLEEQWELAIRRPYYSVGLRHHTKSPQSIKILLL